MYIPLILCTPKSTLMCHAPFAAIRSLVLHVFISIESVQVVYLRQRLDNAVSSSRDRTFSIEATVNMIKNLVDCDEFQDIATLRVSERVQRASSVTDIPNFSCLTACRVCVCVFYRTWKTCSNTTPIYRPNSCRLAIPSCTNWCSGPSVCRFTSNCRSK